MCLEPPAKNTFFSFFLHTEISFFKNKKSRNFNVVLLTNLVYKAIDRYRHHINWFPVFRAGIYIYAPQEITEVSAPAFNQLTNANRLDMNDRPYTKQNVFCKTDGHDEIMSLIMEYLILLHSREMFHPVTNCRNCLFIDI